MRKRFKLSACGFVALGLSVAVAAAMPVVGFAADGSHANDMSAADFSALGLNVDANSASEDNDGSVGPYSNSKPTSLCIANEVYAATNGVAGSRYMVRNQLERLADNSELDTNISDDYGKIYGAYKAWNGVNSISNSQIASQSEYGGGTWSGLSYNRSDAVMATGENGFSGIHATSVAFCDDASKAKDSCIAELRAYGDSSTTVIDGQEVKGAITVKLMQLDAKGNRTDGIPSGAKVLWPTVNTNMTDNGQFDYLTEGYLQSLEAVFDIEAADLDGDGRDEIIVYAGAYEDQGDTRYAIVNCFKHNAEGSGWDTYEVRINAGKAANYSYNTSTYNGFTRYLQKAPVVSLAAGDIDRNGNEDLAITCSVPYGNSDVTAARCEVFTWNNDCLTHVDGIMSDNNGCIGLAAPDGSVGMVAANCAFGTFKAYDDQGNPTGNTVTGLVIAGYESRYKDYSYSDESYFYKAAYRFVYYDTAEGEYRVTDYHSVDMSTDGRRIVETAAKDGDQDNRYYCTLAPIALCAADLEGLAGSGAENDALLVGGDIYNNVTMAAALPTCGIGACTGHISLCNEHYNAENCGAHKNTEQVWIGDVVAGSVAGTGAGDGDDAFNQSFLAVVGTHRDEDLGKDDDYYWMDLSHYTVTQGKAKTSEEGVVCESNRRNSSFGTFISLCLPDIDQDGIRVTYKDQYKLYTNPKVLAVMQDAPYFQDLQNSFDYLVLGGTEFGSGSGGSYSNGFSLEGELSVYIEAEVQAFVDVKEKAAAGGQVGYAYEHEQAYNYTTSYESHAGEGDKVVVYTLPILDYVYDIENEATGEVAELTAPAALEPETSVVSVETYDKIAEANNLTRIDSLLKNNSGDPSSYQTTLSDKKDSNGQAKPATDSFGLGSNKDIERVRTGNGWCGVTSDTGATVSQEIEMETSDNQEFEAGLHVNLEVGGGVGILGSKAETGIEMALGADYSHCWTSATSTIVSGAVDNLPEQAVSDYYFQWRIGVNRYEDSGTDASDDNSDMWLIGYDVTNAKEPDAPAVKGFEANSISDSSVTFSWEDTLSSSSPYHYGIAMLADNTSSSELVPSAVKYVNAGETSYTWEGLDPTTSYRFAIAAVDDNGLQAGIRSAVVEAKTMPQGATMSVAGPDAANISGALDYTSSVHVAPGETTTLTASGFITDSNGKAAYPNFFWYEKKPDEEWKCVKSCASAEGVNYSTLTLSSIQAKDSGTQYYCTVGYNNYAVNTGTTKVVVDEDASSGMKSVNMLSGKYRSLLELIGHNAKKSTAATSAASVTTLLNREDAPVKQALKVTPASKNYKASKLKKKKASFKITVKGAQGTVSYKVTKGKSKCIKVSKKGKVTMKKGAKKSTYKIKVTAAKTRGYTATSKTVTIKVR